MLAIMPPVEGSPVEGSAVDEPLIVGPPPPPPPPPPQAARISAQNEVPKRVRLVKERARP